MGPWAIINSSAITNIISADVTFANSLANAGLNQAIIDISSAAPVPRIGDPYTPASSTFLVSSTAIAPPVIASYTGQQFLPTAVLTDGPVIPWDLNTSQAAKVTLGGNRLIRIINPNEGSTYTLVCIQDSSGSRTLAFTGAQFRWASGTAPVLSTAANAVDVLTFLCHQSGVLLGAITKAFS